MNRLYFVIIIVLLNSIIPAQGFIKITQNDLRLEEQFNSILSEANEDVFIGYSITSNLEKIVSIGTFYIDDENNGFRLSEIIINPSKYNLHYSNRSNNSRIRLHENRFRIIINENREKIKHNDETAIIFHYTKNTSNNYSYNDIMICNLSLNVDFAPNKLYWLGNVKNDKSLKFLFDLYESSSNDEGKEEIIHAIGMHKIHLKVTPFLVSLANDISKPELRETSLYWLAFQDNLDALNTLKNIIYNDDSKRIREEAIMSIAQMNIDEAFNELINIAKRCEETSLRKEAIMWLGEKAVKKASEELKGFIENDPEIEIKKHALYALSEQSNDHLPYIIELAKIHQSLTIRKNAIYILGECDDKRAIDILVNLAFGN